MSREEKCLKCGKNAGGTILVRDGMCSSCFLDKWGREIADLRRQLAQAKEENERLEDRIAEWKEASGLIVGGDPEGVTPAMLENSRSKDEAEIERLREDRTRLDWLDSRRTDYGTGIVFRYSTTGRGWRLHETSKMTGLASPRNGGWDAIDDGIAREAAQAAEEK